VVVLEIQGELIFASAEIVVSEAMTAAEKAEYLILDFNRVANFSEGAYGMLVGLIKSLSLQGKTVLMTSTKNRYTMVNIIKKGVGYNESMPLFNSDDIDDALEWCEDRLLAGQSSYVATEAPLAAQSILANFSHEEMAAFELMLEYRTYDKGMYICREGDPGDSLYFILSGQVSVTVSLAQQRSRRISTISAGSAFGEMAMLDRGKRSADIIADEKVTCLVLDFNLLEAESSPLGMCIRWKLITNIGRELTRKLRQATMEIKFLRS
jgi:glutaminase